MGNFLDVINSLSPDRNAKPREKLYLITDYYNHALCIFSGISLGWSMILSQIQVMHQAIT